MPRISDAFCMSQRVAHVHWPPSGAGANALVEAEVRVLRGVPHHSFYDFLYRHLKALSIDLATFEPLSKIASIPTAAPFSHEQHIPSYSPY